MSERAAPASTWSAAFFLALTALAVLIVVNILTLQARTKSQKSAAAVVNVSGRQRMLSQRMALLAQNLVRAETSHDRDDIRRELAGAIALFERSHRGLTEGDAEMGLPGDLPPEVRAIYFEPPAPLDEQVQRYVKSLKLLIETPDDQLTSNDPSLQIIRATATQRTLLDGLDAAVAAFQHDSEAKVASLERRIWWVFGGALLTVATAFWLAFLIINRTKALEQAHRDGLRMLEDVEKARQTAEQAEREVRASEAKHLAILRTAVDGIITINERGVVESINPAAERLFGYAAGELIGQNVNVLMPRPFSDEHDGYLRRYLETGKKRVIDARRDVTGKRKDGTTFPLELAVSCVQLEDRRLFTGILRDLTERRRAEQQLHLSAEIMENLAEGVNLSRVSDGTIVYTNPRFDEMFRYEPGELTGKHVTVLNASGDRSAGETAAENIRSLEQQGSWSGEVHNVRKDGTCFWTYSNVSTFEHGQYGRVWISVQNDITQRKQAEEDLRESEERFKTLVEYAPEAILLFDVDLGRFVDANENALRLFAMSRDELLTRHPADFSPPTQPDGRPSIDSARERMNQVLEGRKPVFDWLHRNSAGVDIPCEVRLARLPAAGRRLIRASVTDITERTRAAERLRESEVRFRSLVELSQDGIMMVDVEGVIVIVNAETERMFGYAHEELIGRPIEILVPERHRQSHPQKRLAFFKEPVGGLQGSRFEFHGRRRDGSEFPMELGLKPIELADDTFVITTVRDLTERKRLQHEFAVAREIQVALLPKEPPSIPGFEIAGSCWPAESTGGDFYDFIRFDDSHLGVVVGDVSGHGFGPAILTAGAHSYLRAMAKTQPALSPMMEATNRLLYEDTGDGRFITLILAAIDLQKRTLSYVSAGHVDGLIFGGAGAVKQKLPSTATVLGVSPDEQFPVGQSAKLEGGDTLLLLTDGFQETTSDGVGQFGTDRILDCVRANRGKSGREILDELYRAVADFRGASPQQDDLTGVVVKVL